VEDLVREEVALPPEWMLVEAERVIRQGIGGNRTSMCERLEDIPLLTKHFLEKYKHRYGLPEKYLSAATMQWLASRDWPGNVRELQNSVHRGLLLAEGNEIFPQHLQPETSDVSTGAAMHSDGPFKVAKTQAIEQFERHYLNIMLGQCAGNVTLAAERAKIDRSTLGRLLKRHRINYRNFLAR
jgi:DNA-binding NtrC family response regulator